MKCSRREFLGTTALVLFAGTRLAASGSGLAFLILQDTPATWITDDIAAILGYFRTRAMVTTWVASHFSGPSPIESEDGKEVVSKYLGNSLLEVVTPAPPLYQEQRLWHLRAAHDLRQAAERAVAGESGGAFLPAPVTLFQRETDPPLDFSAYRSAGFRVRIVRPETGAATTLLADGRDQLSILGGMVLDLFDPALGPALEAMAPEADVIALHLSLAGGAGLEPPDRAARAEDRPALYRGS